MKMRELTVDEMKRLNNLIDEVEDILNNSDYRVVAALEGLWTDLTYEVEDIGHRRFLESRKKAES